MSNLVLVEYGPRIKGFDDLHEMRTVYEADEDYRNVEFYMERYNTPMCHQENHAIKSLFLPVYEIISDKRIIDLGCGTGLLLQLCPYISQYLYTGIDISNEMIQEAKKNYPYGSFYSDDARVAIKRIKDKHDLVVSLFSIPYIGTSTIEDVYRILRPGGYFFTVFYFLPFLNPASVYFNKERHYIVDVLPQVNKCIERAEQLFKTIYKVPLTSSAYDVALYQKI
ncbi:MAG: methyltransferase domain-containing protein [Treponema sp.]|nr:methyltransferase domain-containing protein [Treponema sp.]